MEKLKIACLIPAFNEESTIARVVGFIPQSFDVFVIDDASTDHTRSNAQSTRAKVICNQSNLGYSKTIKKSLRYLATYNYDYICTFDADGQHTREHLLTLVSYLIDKSSLVYGVRSNLPNFHERAINFMTSILFDRSDIFSGIKILPTSLIRSVNPYSSIDDIGTAYLMAAPESSYAIHQVPINVQTRAAGTSSRFYSALSSYLRLWIAFYDSFRIYYKFRS